MDAPKLEQELGAMQSQSRMGQIQQKVAAGIRRLNRALLTLNFRREPIYLPEDQIATERFAEYAVALRKLDYLQWARHFVTRLIHNETWEHQLADALAQA
jgi:hypothetical protein